MSSNTFNHEDERRSLTELTGDFKAVKILTAKKDCIVGNHFHKNKEECFCLVLGEGDFEFNGGQGTLEIGKWYQCPSFMHHTFTLKKGSILIGTATELFDPNDEMQ